MFKFKVLLSTQLLVKLMLSFTGNCAIPANIMTSWQNLKYTFLNLYTGFLLAVE